MKWSDIFIVLGAFVVLGSLYLALSNGVLGWLLSSQSGKSSSSSTAPRPAVGLLIIGVPLLVAVVGYKLLSGSFEAPPVAKQTPETKIEQRAATETRPSIPEYDIRRQHVAVISVKGGVWRYYFYKDVCRLRPQAGLRYRPEAQGDWIPFTEGTLTIEPAPARIEVTSDNGFTIELFGPEVHVGIGDTVTANNSEVVSASAIPLFVKFDNTSEFFHPLPRTPAEHLDKIIPAGNKNLSLRSETEPLLLKLRLVP